jgi:hypothetical protein
LLLQLVNTTVNDVSLKEGLPYDVALGVIEQRIASLEGGVGALAAGRRVNGCPTD